LNPAQGMQFKGLRPPLFPRGGCAPGTLLRPGPGHGGGRAHEQDLSQHYKRGESAAPALHGQWLCRPRFAVHVPHNLKSGFVAQKQNVFRRRDKRPGSVGVLSTPVSRKVLPVLLKIRFCESVEDYKR
jgi:hypothetical protein